LLITVFLEPLEELLYNYPVIMKFFSIDELLSGAMLWLCNLGILIISSVLCQVSDELIAMTSTHDPLYTCQ